MREEQKHMSIAVGIVAVIGAISFYAVNVNDNVRKANYNEYHRVLTEQQDAHKVKCSDPRAEYEVKKESYMSKYKILLPSDTFDVLNRTTTDDNLEQQSDAQGLKSDKEVVDLLCKEAEAEAKLIKRAEDWTYFKAHWKELVF